ncbi:MAG: hypothetical protein Tsb002_19240 [Wenzhouxiangellaceae bacterium]
MHGISASLTLIVLRHYGHCAYAALIEYSQLFVVSLSLFVFSASATIDFVALSAQFIHWLLPQAPEFRSQLLGVVSWLLIAGNWIVWQRRWLLSPQPLRLLLTLPIPSSQLQSALLMALAIINLPLWMLPSTGLIIAASNGLLPESIMPLLLRLLALVMLTLIWQWCLLLRRWRLLAATGFVVWSIAAVTDIGLQWGFAVFTTVILIRLSKAETRIHLLPTRRLNWRPAASAKGSYGNLQLLSLYLHRYALLRTLMFSLLVLLFAHSVVQAQQNAEAALRVVVTAHLLIALLLSQFTEVISQERYHYRRFFQLLPRLAGYWMWRDLQPALLMNLITVPAYVHVSWRHHLYQQSMISAAAVLMLATLIQLLFASAVRGRRAYAIFLMLGGGWLIHLTMMTDTP